MKEIIEGMMGFVFLSSILFVFARPFVVPQGATPIMGLIKTDVRGSVAVGDSTVKCLRKGVSEAKGILGFSWGDASITSAMRRGRITKINHVDTQTYSILCIYSKYRTIVYGE